MAFIHAVGATRTVSKAVPTIKNNGKVRKWDLNVLYSCNGLVRDFPVEVDVEYLDKQVEDYTKDELLNLCNIMHLDLVFDSTYQSLTATPTETKLNDFDISTLS